MMTGLVLVIATPASGVDRATVTLVAPALPALVTATRTVAVSPLSIVPVGVGAARIGAVGVDRDRDRRSLTACRRRAAGGRDGQRQRAQDAGVGCRDRRDQRDAEPQPCETEMPTSNVLGPWTVAEAATVP